MTPANNLIRLQHRIVLKIIHRFKNRFLHHVYHAFFHKTTQFYVFICNSFPNISRERKNDAADSKLYMQTAITLNI